MSLSFSAVSDDGESDFNGSSSDSPPEDVDWLPWGWGVEEFGGAVNVMIHLFNSIISDAYNSWYALKT